jgi:hypothetical protein
MTSCSWQIFLESSVVKLSATAIELKSRVLLVKGVSPLLRNPYFAGTNNASVCPSLLHFLATVNVWTSCWSKLSLQCRCECCVHWSLQWSESVGKYSDLTRAFLCDLDISPKRGHDPNTLKSVVVPEYSARIVSEIATARFKHFGKPWNFSLWH